MPESVDLMPAPARPAAAPGLDAAAALALLQQGPSAIALCDALGLSPEGLSLPRLDTVSCRGAACTPRQWLLERLRPISEMDRRPLDDRLFDGFEREMFEMFEAEPQWHRLVSDGRRSLAGQLGAIWSVYVFGAAGHACVLHCSWDS